METDQNPIPTTLLEDQDIYTVLDNLFSNTDQNVTNIETTIKAIGSARQTYDDFSVKMDEYIRYERMIDARLDQLKTFVEDGTLIATEQTEMDKIEAKINEITTTYSAAVTKNNTTAETINTQYAVVKDKLISLASQSAKVSNRMGMFNTLISTKRAANYVNTKTVLIKVIPGTYNNDAGLVFDATGLSSGPNHFQLGYDFTLDAVRQAIVYGGFPDFSSDSPKKIVTINIEILSSTGKVMDTTTKFTVHHHYLDPTDGSPKDVYNDITSLSKPPLSLTMSPDDTLVIKPKTPIVITSSMFTISVAPFVAPTVV